MFCETFLVQQRCPDIHGRFLLRGGRRCARYSEVAFVGYELSPSAPVGPCSACLIVFYDERGFDIVGPLDVWGKNQRIGGGRTAALASSSSRCRFVRLAITSGARDCTAGAVCPVRFKIFNKSRRMYE